MIGCHGGPKHQSDWLCIPTVKLLEKGSIIGFLPHYLRSSDRNGMYKACREAHCILLTCNQIILVSKAKLSAWRNYLLQCTDLQDVTTYTGHYTSRMVRRIQSMKSSGRILDSKPTSLLARSLSNRLVTKGEYLFPRSTLPTSQISKRRSLASSCRMMLSIGIVRTM